jgi:hypothetical protein
MSYHRSSENRRRREYDYRDYPLEREDGRFAYEEGGMVSIVRLHYRTTIFIAILTFCLGVLLADYFPSRSSKVIATPAPTPAATPEIPLFNKEPL